MREKTARARDGSSTWLTAATGMLWLGSLAGCAAQPANGVRLWTATYAFGTLGYRDFDVRSYCGERGARRIEVAATPATLAVGVATLGVYTPREVRFECR